MFNKLFAKFTKEDRFFIVAFALTLLFLYVALIINA